MPETINPKEITEQEVEQKISELSKKSDKTPEEVAQLSEFKEERQNRYQKRIDHLTWESKTNAERAKELAEENERLKQEREESARSKEVDVPSRIIKDTIKVGDKTFYTDTALDSMVSAKQMSYSEAVEHQQERLLTQAEERAVARIKNESKNEEDKRIRAEDAKEVFTSNPELSRTLLDGRPNPNFDPESPLYKEVSRIYASGYNSNPRGLSLAISDAKRILGMVDGRVDVSDQMSLHRSKTSSPSHTPRQEESKLTPEEEENAIRQWTRGDSINPKTGRVYTDKEAVEKAKEAKVRRGKK